MTLRARASRPAVAIVALVVLVILAVPSFAGADSVDRWSSHPHAEATPGMERMHELMMSGNPGTARMHERMHESPNETQP
ncbi:MAG: hypothetical protein ACLGI2_12785 [Acidimicrobiia bacterium]